MVNLLRGEPEPLHPRPLKRSAFDDRVEAVANDDNLDEIFNESTESAVAAESDEEMEDVEESPFPQVQLGHVSEEKEDEENFPWEEATVLLHSDDHNAPVKCTYRSLVRQAKQNWPLQYRERTVPAWYQAVRRWCKRNGLSLRKETRSTRQKPRVYRHFTPPSWLLPFVSSLRNSRQQ